tara:strand:- start:66 stop:1583 length:1518 start_codon:yes stop_codon:yes gene_type:complete
MGGGLLQLVVKGSQDVYLTGNPQITFFKMIHKQHTNFSMESIEQHFNGTVDFGRKLNCIISKNGDLIHKIYLSVQIPKIDCETSNSNKFRWLNWLGHNLINKVYVEIGGQIIDEHYGEWLHIWNELSQKSGKQSGYANLVGNVPRLTQVAQGNNDIDDSSSTIPETTLYIPLQFWFCKNPGLALPLIALQYNEVKIIVELNDHNSCCWSTGKYKVSPPTLVNASLFVDYIYLDTEERRTFTQQKHEYLIEQLQFNGQEILNTQTNKIKINFNHPVKELVWIVQPISNIDLSYTNNLGGPQLYNYTDAIDTTYFSGTPNDPMGGGITGGNSNNISWGLPITNHGVSTNNIIAPLSGQNSNTALSNKGFHSITTRSIHDGEISDTSTQKNLPLFDKGYNPILSCKIQINGHDRFSRRDGKYFNIVQPYQHHTNVPSTGINVYSFALYPEDHQPSGTCNFSNIDTSNLLFTLTKESVNLQRKCNIRVYGINYNVLKIDSGMGRLAYTK